MYVYRVAYRHENGDVEGFVGTGINETAAKQDAYRKIRQKITFLASIQEKSGLECSVEINPERLCVSGAGLTAEELESIKNDWKVSERSRHI